MLLMLIRKDWSEMLLMRERMAEQEGCLLLLVHPRPRLLPSSGLWRAFVASLIMVILRKCGFPEPSSPRTGRQVLDASLELS